MPKLTEKKVPLDSLIPDPNNPRLLSGDEQVVPCEDAANGNCVSRTYEKMKKDEFKIHELADSIKENGWIPVDNIFVQTVSHKSLYLVLEGNRRLTALQSIVQDPNVSDDKKIRDVSVVIVEKLANESDEAYNDYISTLLGMRHHGSLIRWTAFAQAKNIYTHYLKEGGYNWNSFVWNVNTAQKIADSLSIGIGGTKGKKDNVSVHSRLLVYRAMQQTNEYINRDDKTVEAGAGVEDGHYSLFSDLLVRGTSPLKTFIKQDPCSFLVDELSLERLVSLCHFDKAGRKDAPIQNPQEWAPLGKILADPNREFLLPRILDNKELPSDVWSEEKAKQMKWQWDNWLREVEEVLKIPDITTDYTDPVIIESFRRLDSVLAALEANKRDVI